MDAWVDLCFAGDQLIPDLVRGAEFSRLLCVKMNVPFFVVSLQLILPVIEVVSFPLLCTLCLLRLSFVELLSGPKGLLDQLFLRYRRASA